MLRYHHYLCSWNLFPVEKDIYGKPSSLGQTPTPRCLRPTVFVSQDMEGMGGSPIQGSFRPPQFAQSREALADVA